jgi:mono/diheme cytochrome c family protein
MTNSSKAGRGLRKALLVCVILLIFIAIGLAAFHGPPWVVPAEQKEMKNPLASSEANLTAAKPLYEDKCANCHGDHGKGDGSDAMMYDPAPPDLTDLKTVKKTDGELFYKISEGRKPMPSFKKKLTDEQRWQLVLYVRALETGSASAIKK